MALTPEDQDTKDASILGGKTTFINHCVSLSRDLETVFACVQQLEKHYFDNTYNSGGTNEIADVDLIGYRFTETELGDFINMCSNVRKFVTSDSTAAAADYVATNNKIK